MTDQAHATSLPGSVAWVAERMGLVAIDGSVRLEDLRSLTVGSLLDAGYMDDVQLGNFMTELSRLLATGTTHMGSVENRSVARPRKRRSTGPTKAEKRAMLSRQMLDHLLARPGSTVDEVADALDVDVDDVTSASPSVDWLILSADHLVETAASAESPAVAATRARALAALQAASLLVAPLSHQGYTGLVRQGRVTGPSVARIVQLFGSWTSACAEAGVRSGEPLRRHYSRTWTRTDALGHVSAFLLEPEYRGASNRYDQWRAARGSALTPSLGTVRNVCGSRWNDVRAAALRSLRSGWAHDGTRV